MELRRISRKIARHYNLTLVGKDPFRHEQLIDAINSGIAEALSGWHATVTSLMPLDVLRMISQSEINYSIQYFFDGGYTVKLGDPVNGFKVASPLCEDFSDVAEWLIEQVLIHYPESEFALFWKQR